MTYDPIAFLETAVDTPSHDDVGPMRDLLVTTLETHGYDPTVDDAGNTIATRGSAQPHIVLNTHIDTVSPHHPYARDDDTIRGRGACDAKGPLTTLLYAFITHPNPADARLTLAVTPDEETASTGAAALDLAADAYIVGEPTGLDVCNAARGRLETTVTIHGENAHAATPDAGVNAIRSAAALLTSLDEFDTTHGPGPHHALGHPTLTPTVIRAGDATNQIPDECTIVLDRRSVPPETARTFIDGLREFTADHAPNAPAPTVAFADRDTPFLEAFETPTTDPLVEAFTGAGARAVRPFGAATEASYFAPNGPTVVFGPGVLADDTGPVAHSDREYIRTTDVTEAIQILDRVLTDYPNQYQPT